MAEAAFLLDTNCLIYLAERRSASLLARVEAYAPGEIVTSAIAFAEFARGVDWSLPYAEATAKQFFATFPVVPFDEEAARAYAALPFRRGAFDRLIAAHAIALGLTLITANPRDFGDVAALKVEDWTR